MGGSPRFSYSDIAPRCHVRSGCEVDHELRGPKEECAEYGEVSDHQMRLNQWWALCRYQEVAQKIP